MTNDAPISDSDQELLRELQSAMFKSIREIGAYLAGPVAPDAEVQSWPLLTGGDEEGGIWCGDGDCPLMAENSEIGDFRHPWDNDGHTIFTMAQLHEAVADHIAARRERENDTDD